MNPADLPYIDTDVDPAQFSSPEFGQALTDLESLLTQSIDANYQGERTIQYLRLERADCFYRGIQNIALSMDDGGALFWASYGQDGAPSSGGGSGNREGMERAFDYNPRLTKGYGDKFTAVLGERPFYSTTAEPENPKDDLDRRAARQVNLLIPLLHAQWNVEQLNRELPYNLFKTGTNIGLLRPITDGGKFGYDEKPDVQLIHMPHPQFPGMMVPIPQQVGTKRTPRSSVDLTLLTGYYATWPFNVKKLHESPWFDVSCDLNWGQLLEALPNARYILGPDGNQGAGFGSALGMGADASATGGVVRASAQSQTGTVRSRDNNLRSYRILWIDKSQINLIHNESSRTILRSVWPNGLRLLQIEGKIVSLRGQDYRTCLSACPPALADYLFADGVSWGMFGLEDATSNLLNIAMQFLETGIPTYLVNQNYVSADAINRNRYSPNLAIGTIPKYGEGLDNAVFTLPQSHFPQEIPEMFGVIKDFVEQFLGLLPQIYGQMPAGLTLGQAKMMLTQGLMQLSTVGMLMGKFWEDTDTNAVKMYAETVTSNPSFDGEEIDLDLIRRGNWKIKGGSTMPRSFAEKKQELQEIITQNPEMAKAMKITDPVNYDKLADYLDLPELDNPARDMVEAMKEIVDQLWSQSPVQIPGPDGQTTPQPSIQYDGLVFDPKISVAVCQASLVSAHGQRQSGSPGYANVRAFLQAAQQALTEANKPIPDPPKLTLSGALDKLPPDQETAILTDYGVKVPQLPPDQPPQPSLHTTGRITEIEAEHQTGMERDVHQAGLQQQQAQEAQYAAMMQGTPPPGAPSGMEPNQPIPMPLAPSGQM